LPNGIPSHDTIGRLFSLLKPEEFQRCFLSWMDAVVDASQGKLIAIDGKTVRRSFDKAKGKAPVHVVSAWASANHLILGQTAVAEKSNEITAIPELLKMLELQGALVTIDAMGCQKEIAKQIVDAGGDYVLSLKDNQPTLCQDVAQIFLKGLEDDFEGLEHRYWSTKDKGHGRMETRHYHVVAAPEEFVAKHPEWKGLQTLGMVYRERQMGQDKISEETAFFIGSIEPKVKLFAEGVRNHWSVENNLHWVLDMSFREDESRVRKDHAPENLAMLRRTALTLLKSDRKGKNGMACRRKQAGWNNAYLLRVLLGQNK
jgi:predicted transposase YbfD/YdcC